MLSSANYNTGPVFITKGVKILAIPGQMGSVLATGGDAIVINAPGKDVTLRNLFVLESNAGANGVNIQNAAAVHIEQTTIHDFSGNTSSCINFSSAASVRLFVVDSFLRHCRVAIFAHQTAVPAGNRSSVVIDNTRMERGFADEAGTTAYGIVQRGCIDVSLRNSMISRHDVGVQFDGLLANCTSHLQITDSHLTRNTTGVRVTSGTVNGYAQVAIMRSEITNGGDGIIAAHSATGTGLQLHVSDSTIGFHGNNGITASNTAADVNSTFSINLVKSQVYNVTNAVDLSATNGSRTTFYARDSTLSNADRLVKTSGSGVGRVTASLIRSNLQHATYGVDHGFGTVRLDGSHFTHLANTFVNNGSGDIKSLGNNWLSDFSNTSGFTYITPAVIAPF
jgi:hypothetical protein